MTPNEYQDFLIRQRKLFTPKMKEAIDRQNALSKQAYLAREKWYKLEYSYRLKFSSGCKKLFDKYPDILSQLPGENSIYGNMKVLMKGSLENKYKDTMKKYNEFPELVECQSLNSKISEACFEYAVCLTKQNQQIEKDRKDLFSKDYLNRMDELADKGIFLYFLETPDLPLLDGDSDTFILDTFSFNNYISSKSLLSTFFSMGNVSPSMNRKQEDVAVALELMSNNVYRTAARNWFSLIESEHKKAAEAFNGFFEKETKLRTGKNRSDKIFESLQLFPLDWEKHAWEKIDCYYQKVVTNVSGYPNRNAVTHGDYDKDDLDITEYDCVKLLLLFINLRLIADAFCNLEELYENLITMMPTILDLLEKNILTLPSD